MTIQDHDILSEARDVPGRIPATFRRYVPTPARASLVYIYAAGFLLFSLWIPDLWLSWSTSRLILNIAFTVPAIVAVGLILPLSAGVFDLSISGSINLSSVMIAWLVVKQGWSIFPAILVTLLVCLAVGAINGLLIEKIGIDSFVATLATGAIAGAAAVWLSANQQIAGFPASFANFSGHVLFGGVQIQVLYLVIIALIVWYVLEHTPAGRFLQATGENREAATLAGVRTHRYVYGSLLASAVVAGFAGIVQTATIGVGQSGLGSPYLLSAFAACFLGATQFKARFNVAGTLASVWVLSSGVQGVTLATSGYPWLNDLFFGIALLIAVGLSRSLERYAAYRMIRRRTSLALRSTRSTPQGTGQSRCPELEKATAPVTPAHGG